MVPEWFWKAAFIVVGLAVIAALSVLGLYLAVTAGRADFDYAIGAWFSHSWWR